MEEKAEVLKRIDKISSRIRELWSGISVNDTSKMQESWKDTACDEYIKKIKKLDRIVVQLTDELDVLRSYWEKTNPEDPIPNENNNQVSEGDKSE